MIATNRRRSYGAQPGNMRTRVYSVQPVTAARPHDLGACEFRHDMGGDSFSPPSQHAWMLAAADWGLTLAHVAVILAFVFLWIPRSTARMHGWLVALTAASWLGLGASRGLGYCVLTDLHWQVKHARGATHLPHSFIKYVADAVTGRDVPSALLNGVAGVVFVAGCVAAVWRWRERRGQRRGATP